MTERPYPAYAEHEPKCRYPVSKKAANKTTNNDGWLPIESAPKGRTVLVYYKNNNGKGRIIRARYVEKYTEEETGESDLQCDYSEEKDCYYWPEGWYEEIENYEEYGSVKFKQNITHWMPLPAAPQPTKGE